MSMLALISTILLWMWGKKPHLWMTNFAGISAGVHSAMSAGDALLLT